MFNLVSSSNLEMYVASLRGASCLETAVIIALDKRGRRLLKNCSGNSIETNNSCRKEADEDFLFPVLQMCPLRLKQHLFLLAGSEVFWQISLCVKFCSWLKKLQYAVRESFLETARCSTQCQHYVGPGGVVLLTGGFTVK